MKNPLIPLLSALCSFSVLSAETKPNVLFIAVDDLRPDLGCYGVKHAKTPNIDTLAARGIVFDKAYCAQAVCSPSRTAILTGLRPDTTKVWDLDTHFRKAQPNCVTLPQHFRANGYHTSALGKIEHHGFEDGASWSEPRWYPNGVMVKVDEQDWTKRTVTRFQGVGSEFAKPVKKGDKLKNGKLPKNGTAYEISPKSDEQLPDGAVAVETVNRLAALKAAGKPFFLAVGFVKPHLPFVAPKKYWDMHDPDQIPLPSIVNYPEGTPSFVGHGNGELHSYPGVPQGNPISEKYAKTLRHGYHACISFMDAQVGKILDALKKEGLAENTIVVLWGDHGWQLGDHGLWHKHTNFEIATRSPLIITLPKSTTAGKHCAAPVEFVDIYPTLAEVCGLNIPKNLAGMSLQPYLTNPNAPMQKPAVSVYPKFSQEHGGHLMGYSVRIEDWRCTFWRKRNTADITFTELYDQKNDPHETVNIATKTEHATLIESLKKHLPPAGCDAQLPENSKPTNTTNEPRDKRYDRLYPGKAKLTEAEYLAKQGSDQPAAKSRFAKLDANKDGFITRDEFIHSGKK